MKSFRKAGKGSVFIFFTFSQLLTPDSLLLTPAFGQFDMQLGTQPGYDLKDSTSPAKPFSDPFADVLANKLLANKPTAYWQIVEISSVSTAKDLTAFLRDGFGRLELTTLLLMAEQSKQKIKDVLSQRVSGKKLKAIAEEYKLTYTTIRGEAIQLKEKLVAEMRLKLENERHGRTTEPSTSTTTQRAR